MRELLRDAPPWGERAYQLAFLYLVLQTGAMILATRTSKEDLPAPPGTEVRMFSTVWILAYLLCVLVWWKPKPGGPPSAVERG